MDTSVLSEQITADRLKIGKPDKKGNDVTGGYLFEMDRRVKNIEPEDNWPNGLILHSPNKEELTKEQREYVSSMWDSLNHFLTEGIRSEWIKIIDETSFADFQLVQEFAFNTDGYNNSSFLYKFNDKVDNRFRMAVWDFNITYGNNNVDNSWKTDDWHYKRVVPSWWKHINEDNDYKTLLKKRWREYREGSYSKTNIEHIIDSMVTVLTVGGAEKRNSSAWRIWRCSDEEWKGPTYIWPNKYISSSYLDEIDYLKNWINKRLDWMDRQLEYYEPQEQMH